ncbi:hypothetical protein FGG08_002842 [Glutinoglossum americanum]|uniref:NAD-dependent epimerase/dehydratase domain-containing protein n=1 Tax=Glutinoglossum americanum TaxID=1670608 RepID=A0A9P8I405_9PEZI|nr:hypothetical protein FGG08_002842 [Glutinoglossum americanum]
MVGRVLLTGGNGFVGAHILEQLLAKGFQVRSVVRSQAKAEQVHSDHPNAGSKLDFFIVPDITTAGAFNEAVKSTPPFDTIIHTASPFLYSAANDNLDFLNPALLGTTEILKSTKSFAPEVKRVIITSSFAAVIDASVPEDAGKIYTSEDWNPVSWDEALTLDKAWAYRASKKFAEKAAWDFLRNEKPHFDLVTFNPPMVYGPLRHSVSKITDLNQSNARIWNLFINSSKDAELPPNGLYIFADVRDLAYAHVQAALLPEASNRRFIFSRSQVSSQEISDILRENLPELAERTPIGRPGTKSLHKGAYDADSTLVKDVLKIRFRSVESTFVDLAKQLLEFERQGRHDRKVGY